MNQPTLRQTEEELVAVYHTFYPKVYNYFRCHILWDVQAQDLTGEVFLRVAAMFRHYDERRASISTWIFTIAKNVLIDYYRKRKYQTEDLNNQIAASGEFIDDLIREEQCIILKKALQLLSQKERDIIAMKYTLEMKHTEIAQVLGISVSNVGTIHFRAIQKLKNELSHLM